MKARKTLAGFTLVETIVAIAIFVLFTLGVYEGIRYIYKVVYLSRVRILETEILSEELEVARNLPYESIGLVNGYPPGILPHTTTLTRNDTIFNIVNTVRSYDDPFDGMATGTPTKDTSPADYKLVEMSAICAYCQQKEPVILSTLVAPKQLEGASQNGALFIQVFDSNGLAVQGASVHIVNSSTLPVLVMDDTTGNDGWLRLVDVPTGTLNYVINVSEDGYSSDYTSSPPSPSSPFKPASTVASQTVTEVAFSIDRLGAMNIQTLSPACAAMGNLYFRLYGEKKIGLTPNVYKYDHVLESSAAGEYDMPSVEWDKYHVAPSSSAYDLAGSIPLLPIDLSAGATQEVSLIFRPHTSRSLLVQVRDAGTGLPLSDATVRLYKTGYDETLTTGLGYTRQTDWSGGDGQENFTNETKYFSGDGNIDDNSPAGDLQLKKTGNHYALSGWLESSTFDIGEGITYRNVVWEPISQPVETGANSVRLQIATSDTSTPASWNFVGPDGTAATYYTATSTLIADANNNQRYLRYRVYLSTVDEHFTPTFSEVAITFTSGCQPPGQAFYYGLSSGSYTYEISRGGYISDSDTITIDNNNELNVDLSTVE